MNTKVLLGITGSIAAYKTPDLIRLMRQQSYDVSVMLTEKAQDFVTPVTLETVSESSIYVQDGVDQGKISHINLADTHDVCVIAPATANHIAQLANGFAHDLVSMAFLSFKGPRLIVPAMHTQMYIDESTQKNCQKLRDKGVHILGPVQGELASGDFGLGRMAPIEDICAYLDVLKTRQPLVLKNRSILVCFGGTKEPIDAVRYIGNHSSGKLGNAIASLGVYFGATIHTVSTVDTENICFKKQMKVQSVNEMQNALNDSISDVDTVIMAAAVSDFTVPIEKKKVSRDKPLSLSLTPTPDLLQWLSVNYSDKTYVGFCLSDEDLLSTAKEKMNKKNCNIMVANNSLNFGKDKRTVSILQKDSGDVLNLTDISLFELAYEILKLI